jgi:hypothetical protein
MHDVKASRIMSRTTIDLDPTVLRQLKARQRREGKTLGRLVSELLSTAMQADGDEPRPPAPLAWSARSMRALVDLEDPEALRRALDAS